MSHDVGPSNPDPLEMELAALRPSGPSTGLFRRIGQELGEDGEFTGRAGPLAIGRGGPVPHGLRWLIGIGAGLAAAVVAVAAIRHVRAPRPPTERGTQIAVGPVTSRPAVTEREQPITLAACRSALAESPEAL